MKFTSNFCVKSHRTAFLVNLWHSAKKKALTKIIFMKKHEFNILSNILKHILHSRKLSCTGFFFFFFAFAFAYGHFSWCWMFISLLSPLEKKSGHGSQKLELCSAFNFTTSVQAILPSIMHALIKRWPIGVWVLSVLQEQGR